MRPRVVDRATHARDSGANHVAERIYDQSSNPVAPSVAPAATFRATLRAVVGGGTGSPFAVTTGAFAHGAVLVGVSAATPDPGAGTIIGLLSHAFAIRVSSEYALPGL